MTMRFISSLVIAALMLQFSFALSAHAAVRDWERSVSIHPDGTNDYATDAFKQSIRNAKDAGANWVNLLIPYYQTDTNTHDISGGHNTPTDAALVSGIQYAHSLGLKVSIALYLDVRNGQWRAYINPSDRSAWYGRYGDLLVHYGQIAQAQGVEQFVLGAELISVTSPLRNSENTVRWQNLIARVRAVYGGQLTYSANRGIDSDFGSELGQIQFWDKLDLMGVSGYYSLWGDGSVQSLVAGWQGVNDSNIKPMYDKWHKPIIFTEIGYRSVAGAHEQPWDSGMQGPYDPQEQVRDYTALHEYWDNYPYVQGVMLWWWKTNPSAGGAGDTDYTPQNKPAEQVLRDWWLTPPPISGPIAFSASGSATPANVQVGQSVALQATVTETSGFTTADIIDFEVYNGSSKVFQQFFAGQNFDTRQSRAFSANWIPTTSGTYTFKLGVFNSDWSKNYLWQNSVATITVGANGGGGTPPPAGSYTTEVWWPTDGARVSGVQPFKAMLQGLDVSQYSMFWSVDGGGLVPMPTNTTDYPHKEALVDLSGWNWRGQGPYTVTFTSKNGSGATISQKSIQLFR